MHKYLTKIDIFCIIIVAKLNITGQARRNIVKNSMTEGGETNENNRCSYKKGFD